VIQYVLQLVFGWHAMLGGGEPPVHWTASYVDGAGTHAIEVWRQPGHVRRITDRVLELDAVRPTGEGFRFSLNDRRRGLTFHGSQHDRIMQGSFDDWQTWTHVVAPGRPDALVFPIDRPVLTTPAGRCRWFRDAGTELCWSRSLALPLVIRADGKDVYTVTSSEPLRGALPPFVPVGTEVGGDDD
jgi:hypothetical protein